MSLYDGVVVWVLRDGTLVNRFAGSGTGLERRIDDLIAALPPTGSGASVLVRGVAACSGV